MENINIEDLITRLEVSKRAGVSAPAVTKACGVGKQLNPAIVGKKINANHPAAIAYIAAHNGYSENGAGGVTKNAKPTTGRVRKRPHDEGHSYEVPDNIQHMADMTIRDVVQQFGTDYMFLDYLRAVKEIETIADRRIKNAKAAGELVSRDLVKRGIIDPIDATLTKLLTDGAKTITRRVTALHDAGKDLNEIEEFVRDQITSFVRPMKAKVKRAFENV